MNQQRKAFIRVVKAAIQKRMQILLTTSPLEFLQENYDIVQSSKILVGIFQNKVNVDRQKFLGHSLIAGTRLWEQYRKNELRLPICYFRAQIDLKPQLEMMKQIFNENDIIVPFPHQNIIQQAKNDVLANLATFNILAQEQLTAQNIEQFFQQTQIMGFYSVTKLTGLSAYDGSIIYVNLRIIDSEQLKGTLALETGHNLPRSRMAYHYPRSISCENNPLQVINNQQAEAGYFVEYWVYQRNASPIDPFSFRLEKDQMILLKKNQFLKPKQKKFIMIFQ